MSTLLSFDLDLGIQDYAGDTAKEVAEIYDRKECLDVIREHLKKVKLKSPNSVNSTEAMSDSVTAALTATHKTIGSSPLGSQRNSTSTKVDTSCSSNDGFHSANCAHPEVHLRTENTSS